MQGSESGWDWALNTELQSNYSGPANALAGLATLSSPGPMMGGLGTNALLSLTPKAQPYYLATWAVANFGHELQKPFWTDDEFVAILLGLDPMFARYEDLAPNRYKDSTATEGMRLHEIVQRAHYVGELGIEPSPQDALDWALQRHIFVPPQLLTIAAQRNIALFNSPTQLEAIMSECAAQVAKLNSEVERWKVIAKSSAAAVEDACTKLTDRDTEMHQLRHQLSEAVSKVELLQLAAPIAEEKPKSSSAVTREYRTAVKLLYSVVSTNYGYDANRADWQKKRLAADLAGCATSVNDETLMKHLRAGAEEASR